VERRRGARRRWKALLLLAAVAGTPAAAGRAESGARERAAGALEQSLKADPDNAYLWLHLGFAYRRLEQLDRARAAFEKASALDSKNLESLYMLALIHEKQERPQEALRVWKQYLSVAEEPAKRSVAEAHIHRLSR
jgi:cytochrome c-type biogenesis protein CcmH/NrfG